MKIKLKKLLEFIINGKFPYLDRNTVSRTVSLKTNDLSLFGAVKKTENLMRGYHDHKTNDRNPKSLFFSPHLEKKRNVIFSFDGNRV